MSGAIWMAMQQLAMAPAPGGGTGDGPPPWASFVPLIFLFAVFYFLLIRPQQKRQKDHERLLETVKKGDHVVTAGGILGVVSNVKETTFTVRIADGVKVEVNKGSITSVTRSGDGDDR